MFRMAYVRNTIAGSFENGAVEELHVSLSTYNKTKAGASKILTLQKGFFGLPVITKGL